MRAYDADYVEFVDARQGVLRRIAYAVCRDDARAEDVLQEALVKLYLAWPRVGGTGREEAYARRIIVNADLDQRRRQWHRRRSSVPVELLDGPARSGPATEDRLELLTELRLLPPMQRRTVVLRYWLGFSVEETARELSISEGTVKSHSSRGLATLRDRMGERVSAG
ncbi:sigma-70 family RNA polymerase sigma factor [Nocardioides KLBMP 9356]|uniref:Sigma-70 family RNA polymerase sigma factor n=1 Tax=Nocardioides potassii TaxID=2911371 RepID=A0ABS9HB29_9ACTN|nr:sigma-70 family RNA polymerase sigma factor [Nocardioides potassii]MCF6378382.1 sigma-70 family RNA polymerase sigma factor [Nocardioides potassii]